MNRKFYIDLAEGGLKMPIGADLVLKEKKNAEESRLNGASLGEVVAETARRYKTPLAFPLMDLTVEKEWMLSILGISAAEIGSWHFRECPGEKEIAGIREGIGSVLTPKIRANCEAIGYVGEQAGLVPVGMAIGPFSLMTKFVSDPITSVYLAGMGLTSADEQEVRQVEAILDLGLEVILKSIRLQVEAGAKAICVCEPAANKVYFSPIQMEGGSNVFDRYVLMYNKRIREFLAEMDVDLIFHNCGELTDAMLLKFNELDPAILSLGSSRDLPHDAGLISKNTVLFGNLPTKKFYSDVDLPLAKVREMTAFLKKRMKDSGHPFILGSECDVLHVPNSNKTITEKINAMLQES